MRFDTRNSKKKKRKNNHIETRDQSEFVAWVHRDYGTTIWQKLNHCPIGEFRDIVTAQRLKVMGAKAGFSDLVLYEPRGPYIGWCTEFKKDADSKLTDEQQFWLDVMKSCGFYTAVIFGIDTMKQSFDDYMKLGKFNVHNFAQSMKV